MFVDPSLRAPVPRFVHDQSDQPGFADLIVSIVGYWLAVCLLTTLIAQAFHGPVVPPGGYARLERPLDCLADMHEFVPEIGICARAHHLPDVEAHHVPLV